MTTDSSQPISCLRTRPAERVLAHSLFIVISILVAFPLYWLVLTSFRGLGEIYSPRPFAQSPTLENYRTAVKALPLVQLLMNTVVMSVLRTAAQILTGLLAAFALTRWKFRGSAVVLALFTFTWLVPQQVTMIPNYVLLSKLGWLNSQLALVVPHMVAPFGLFLFYQTMRSFPASLMDSADIDGAGHWMLLWHIIVPNLTSSISAVAILCFVGSWNDYFWPVLVTNRLENSVIQVGLQSFLTQEGNSWGPLMALATLAILPIFLLYVFFQSRITDAFVRSGLR